MEEVQLEMASVDEFRPELTAYCYRMLGSIFDADDAVQETLLRVWQSWSEFRQDSAVRTWVYRIATNVCIDKLRQQKRRALPVDLTGPTSPIVVPEQTTPLNDWIWPAPDFKGDPADVSVRRESVRLAFVALLQLLPARQRAAIILHDIFRWSADETALVLKTTRAAVNSALQRARGTLDRAKLTSEQVAVSSGELDHDLLNRYVQAFEEFDVDGLIALFHEDGSLSMPPFTMWVQGADNVRAFYEATRFHCLGSRLLPVWANGEPGFGQYVPDLADGVMKPWGIHVLECRNGQIAHVHTFIDPRLYPRFGLPESISLQDQSGA
jgi:RNA polymerase sigma-70 factor (ECF subfamily)